MLVDHALELLAPLGVARARRMFGGHGLYVDDLFIALIAGERLYLKTDDQTRSHFRAAGCEPFVYSRSGEDNVTLGYWTVPPDALESPALMQPWARLALEAALRARTAKPAPRKKKVATARKTATAPAGQAAKPAAGKTAKPATAGKPAPRAARKPADAAPPASAARQPVRKAPRAGPAPASLPPAPGAALRSRASQAASRRKPGSRGDR